jgi:hypothetical protein
MKKIDVFNEIALEVERQQTLGFDDSKNTGNDWVAYITAYAGRATTARKNKDLDFHRNMVKVAALAVSAIYANEKGLC